jgi:CBS domain-containing protein
MDAGLAEAALRPADEAWTALVRFSEAGSGRLPVVDEAGRPIGMLTRSDVMMLFRLGRGGREVG